MFDLRRAQEWTTRPDALVRSTARHGPVPGQLPRLPRGADALPRRVGGRDDRGAAGTRWLSRPPPEPAVGEAIYSWRSSTDCAGAFADGGYRLPRGRYVGAAAGARPGAAAARPGRRRRSRQRRSDALWPRRRTKRSARGCSSLRSRSPWRQAMSCGARALADRLSRIADRPMRRSFGRWPLRAEGAVRLAEGDVEGALRVLRGAWEAWRSSMRRTRRPVCGR